MATAKLYSMNDTPS